MSTRFRNETRSDSPEPDYCLEEDEYWNPPCRACFIVDDEPNVLCELCNDLYHVACVAKMKPALPRTPADEEWFCRRCVRKGVPEIIFDHVGRDSAAHYLVKWMGRPTWEVSWEDGKTLDTAWSRKVIGSYLESLPARRGLPLLPPCHTLVDTRRALIDAYRAAKASAPAAAASQAAPPMLGIADAIQWMAWNAAWHASNARVGNEAEATEALVAHQHHASSLAVMLPAGLAESIRALCSDAAWHAANDRAGYAKDADRASVRCERHAAKLAK
eukprot:5567567-Prymnesium_polylepis.1